MTMATERRRESRLNYHWPVWITSDLNETFLQCQMVDISSEGAAFTCYSHENVPQTGDEITSRFSIPRFRLADRFDMTDFSRKGKVCRIKSVNSFLKKIAVQFAEPLPFKPGEQLSGYEETQQRLENISA